MDDAHHIPQFSLAYNHGFFGFKAAMTKQFDVAVIGAGAAGMMCAGVAAQRGKKVVLIDHATKLAEKIRISGGGRCNFTNIDTTPQNFISQNPHFCKSALSRYTPQDFLVLTKRHRIRFHEKHKGQLFCDNSSEDIINMLRAECDAGGVTWRMPCKVGAIGKAGDAFRIEADTEELRVDHVVIATGGLSIPKIGATDFAYRIAKQFGLKVVETRPGLVPLTFDADAWQAFVQLAGVALPVHIETGEKKSRQHFREDLLFTHRGLSGPAVLQISSYWTPGTPIRLDLVPEIDLAEELVTSKNSIKKDLDNHLTQWLPARLVQEWLAANDFKPDARVADLPDKQLRRLGESLKRWSIIPTGSEGYRKAEVTCGGIDTKELSQQTMMANAVPKLYFIGEAVDVTGWLGGYNFQWAWASGMAAGLSV
jgi:predicted Rossmann fold flavoprotein